MEFQNALLCHAAALLPDERDGGAVVCRVPEEVRHRLNRKAQSNILFASNSELRFVMEGETVTISLRRLPVSGQIRPSGILEVFQGGCQGSYEISPGVVFTDDTTISIRRQDWSHIGCFPTTPGGFAPQVTRVLLPYDWGCAVGEIKSAIRPPKPEEMPDRRLLVYGSSITHGGSASVPSRTYAFQLAWELGFDLINLGSAGSAYLDEAMAEYIAGRKDWDAAVFELGVNVIEEWTALQLYERACAWIDTVKRAHPDKPVIVTDMFYNRYDFEEQEKAAAFRKSIETCMFRLQTSYKQLYYVNGWQLMGSVRGLSSDGLHPSDTGHTMIARSLSEFMKAHAI